MFHGLQTVEVWRKDTATVSGNWGNPTFTYHHTARDVSYQPFSSNEMVRNNSMFANVIGVIICNIDEDIQNYDELVFNDGTYKRVHVVEPWDSGVIPHKEIYITDSQWNREL